MLLKSPPSAFSLARKLRVQPTTILHRPSLSTLPYFNGSIVKLPLTSNATAVPGFTIKAAAAANEANSNRAILNVEFEPFEDLNEELLLVPTAPQESIARYKFTDSCEVAINVQINVEYNVSYVYHALYAYFDRDNVALKGLARFFKESSVEERQHAEKLMEYQNKRGGRVKLQMMKKPLCDNCDDLEKGDALYAMELALSLEKLTNAKLLNLQKIAEENNDTQMAEFVEREFLSEQVDAIKKISEYVAQLRRVGKGHGVWAFDQMLLADVRAA